MHHKDIAHCDEVRSASIDAKSIAIPYQVDGDYLGSTMHADVRFIPDALKIVVPTVA